MREVKLDKAKEIRKLREQIEAPTAENTARMQMLGSQSAVMGMGIPHIKKNHSGSVVDDIDIRMKQL